MGIDGDNPRPKIFVENARNKRLAGGIYDLQQEVVSGLIWLSEERPDRFFKELGGCRDDEAIWMYIEGPLLHFREVNYGIAHFFLREPEHYRKVGVYTSTRIELGLYTDNETWEAYRQEYAYDWGQRFDLTVEEVKKLVSSDFTEEEVEDMTYPRRNSDRDSFTYYFVDREGHHAKVVNIPEAVAEGRQDLEIEGHPISGVISAQALIYPQDFVYMKTALAAIQSEIEK